MEGGMNLVEMWSQMGFVAKGIGYILFIMSFWSVGVAVERIYTYRKARAQSKLFAPQVAKHLKEGRLEGCDRHSGTRRNINTATWQRSSGLDYRNISSSRKVAALVSDERTC